LIADPKTKLVLSVDQDVGCVHDFRIYKDSTGAAVSPDIQAKMDSGYQGIAAYHANSKIPYKKSKNHPLTPEEKAFNRQLARERIVIEHINREIKVFKIMAERYRNRRRRHKLRMTLICAIRNHEIIQNVG
jgi:transposase